jgi:hypothetical protein
VAKRGAVAFQVLQIVLALAICGAYAALQFGFVHPDDRRYLFTNFVCAAGLTVVALIAFQLGFVISNGLWAVVSMAGLVRITQQRRKDER